MEKLNAKLNEREEILNRNIYNSFIILSVEENILSISISISRTRKKEKGKNDDSFFHLKKVEENALSISISLYFTSPLLQKLIAHRMSEREREREILNRNIKSLNIDNSLIN